MHTIRAIGLAVAIGVVAVAVGHPAFAEPLTSGCPQSNCGPIMKPVDPIAEPRESDG
jgi:hypothetical protein